MIDKVLVARDDDGDSGSCGAGEKLVVVRVCGNGCRQGRSLDDLGLDRQESKDRLEIHAGVLGAESLADTLVFVEDVGRKYELNSTVTLRFEDPSGNTTEEAG